MRISRREGVTYRKSIARCRSEKPSREAATCGKPHIEPAGRRCGVETGIPFRASEMSANTQRMTSPLVGAQGYICHPPGVPFGHPGLIMTSALAGLGGMCDFFSDLRASVVRGDFYPGPAGLGGMCDFFSGLRALIVRGDFFSGFAGFGCVGTIFFPGSCVPRLGWLFPISGAGMCGAERRSGGAAVIIGNPARSVGPAGYQYEDSLGETSL